MQQSKVDKSSRCDNLVQSRCLCFVHRFKSVTFQLMIQKLIKWLSYVCVKWGSFCVVALLIRVLVYGKERLMVTGKLSKVGVISDHEGPAKCLQVSPGNFGSGFFLYSGSLDSFLSTNFFLIIVHWVILIVDFPSLRSPRQVSTREI